MKNNKMLKTLDEQIIRNRVTDLDKISLDTFQLVNRFNDIEHDDNKVKLWEQNELQFYKNRYSLTPEEYQQNINVVRTFQRLDVLQFSNNTIYLYNIIDNIKRVQNKLFKYCLNDCKGSIDGCNEYMGIVDNDSCLWYNTMLEDINKIKNNNGLTTFPILEDIIKYDDNIKSS